MDGLLLFWFFLEMFLAAMALYLGMVMVKVREEEEEEECTTIKTTGFCARIFLVCQLSVLIPFFVKLQAIKSCCRFWFPWSVLHVQPGTQQDII